jgi:hypothetical protein
MKNKVPMTRLNKFFSQSDFDLNLDLGKEYLHGDINMKLVLYRVDRSKSNIDSVYSQVGKDEIKFFPPIEFNALVRVEDPKNSAYKNGLVRFNEPGNLNLSVYIRHLEELKIDIIYGDFIGYSDSVEKIRYYTVVNDGKVVSDNKHKMFGTSPYYRTIICAPAQKSEFGGI